MSHENHDSFQTVLGENRGPTGSLSQFRARILALERELADERGEPRPGEDFRLEMGAMGNGRVSYFAEDRKTKVLVHVHGVDDKSAKRTAYSQLRLAISPSYINVGWPNRESIHAALCNCPACGQGGIKPEDPEG